MIDTALALLAPHHCYGCTAIGQILCDNCKNNIINETFDGCIGCGGMAAGRGICSSCRLPYSQAWVADVYRGPLGEAIKGMKIVAKREVAGILGQLLAEIMPTLPSNVAIVPIPTARAHVRRQGFDHTMVIAGVMAAQLGVAVAPVLHRVGMASQRGATARRRALQAKTAFQVGEALNPNYIYLVIDDVVTTGATIREAGLTLQRAGARQLWVASLTRETLD